MSQKKWISLSDLAAPTNPKPATIAVTGFDGSKTVYMGQHSGGQANWTHLKRRGRQLVKGPVPPRFGRQLQRQQREQEDQRR